jgi:hypothetical protein
MSLTGQDEVPMAARRGKPSAWRIGRKPVPAQSRPAATHSGSTSTSRSSAPTLRVSSRSCSLGDAAQVVVLDLVAATGPADLVLAPIRIPHIPLRSRALAGTPRLRPAARARLSYEKLYDLLAVNLIKSADLAGVLAFNPGPRHAKRDRKARQWPVESGIRALIRREGAGF